MFITHGVLPKGCFMKVSLVDIKTGLAVSSVRVAGCRKFYLCISGVELHAQLLDYPDLSGVVYMVFSRRRGGFQYEAVSSQAQIYMCSQKGILKDGEAIVLASRTFALRINKRPIPGAIVAAILFAAAVFAAIYFYRSWGDNLKDEPVPASFEKESSGYADVMASPPQYAAAVYKPEKNSIAEYWSYLDGRWARPAGEDFNDEPSRAEKPDSAQVENEIEYAKMVELYQGCEDALRIYRDLKKRFVRADPAYHEHIDSGIKRCQALEE
jgi:hypothetical protein